MSRLLIGNYPATIYPERNGYSGVVSLGFDAKGNRQRIKRKGRTKEIVKDKLRRAVNELGVGIDTSDSYTVENAVRDWLVVGGALVIPTGLLSRLRGGTGALPETPMRLAAIQTVAAAERTLGRTPAEVPPGGTGLRH